MDKNSVSQSKAEVSFTERQVNFDETNNNDGDNPSVPKLLEATGTSLIAKQETFSRINQSTPSTADVPVPSLGPAPYSLPDNSINQPPARPSFQSQNNLKQPGSARPVPSMVVITDSLYGRPTLIRNRAPESFLFQTKKPSHLEDLQRFPFHLQLISPWQRLRTQRP